ncbi:MAG TPA: hypothetical protein VE487_11110 [Ilumatobacter sp.]|jgi:hypothetical protein|nr:hypothetical protein [Ilumatobacter sp.]
MNTDVMRRASRIAPAAFAAILVLGACGSDGDGDGASEQSPPTPIVSSDEEPATTQPPPPTTQPRPTTGPPPTTVPVSPPPTVPHDQVYELIGTVIEESDGPRLCYMVLESLPPQCGGGVALVDWSWDAITVERVDTDVTWVEQIYVSGTYDDAAQTFTVGAARLPTDEERERLMGRQPFPDLSVPCAPPDGGWPALTHQWPGEEIAALDGYAGAWVNEGQPVMTVKFTGDLATAEAAVREHYSGPLCVVAAEHSHAQLSAIQQQLQEMSSIQFLGSSIYVDASGEWVAAETFAPEPARQAAFDEQFGAGVVRLSSLLQPVPAA